jgi:hypothetical protein
MALDINARGDIVGVYYTSASTISFLSRKGGTIETIAMPGADYTTVSGINDRGDVVGCYSVGQQFGGFVRFANGEYEAVHIPGIDGCLSDVDNALNAIGWYRLEVGGGLQGFIVEDGEVTLLMNPWGLPVTAPEGIAENGVIVGYASGLGDQGMVGFKYDGRTWTKVVVPGASMTALCGVSANGLVTGWSVFPTGQRGVILSKDAIQILDILNVAFGVSPSGFVVGFTPDAGRSSIRAAVLGRFTRGMLGK